MGTNKGFSCISVPGSGSAFYDSFELNPFESKKQKRESLVHRLL
jgi:U3 small nucleolar RNA-associated protein 7